MAEQLCFLDSGEFRRIPLLFVERTGSWPCSGSGGFYQHITRFLVLCEPQDIAGRTALTADGIETVGHEVFHAVQRTYLPPGVLSRFSFRGAFVEASATLAGGTFANGAPEFSLHRSTLFSAPRLGDPVREPASPFLITRIADYRAQDFWAWTLHDEAQPFGFLAQVMEEATSPATNPFGGFATPEIDAALGRLGSTGLADRWWDWARDHGYERDPDTPERINGNAGRLAACTPIPGEATRYTADTGASQNTFDVTAPPLEVLADPVVDGERRGTLGPLAATVNRITVTNGTGQPQPFRLELQPDQPAPQVERLRLTAYWTPADSLYAPCEALELQPSSDGVDNFGEIRLQIPPGGGDLTILVGNVNVASDVTEVVRLRWSGIEPPDPAPGGPGVPDGLLPPPGEPFAAGTLFSVIRDQVTCPAFGGLKEPQGFFTFYQLAGAGQTLFVDLANNQVTPLTGLTWAPTAGGGLTLTQTLTAASDGATALRYEGQPRPDGRIGGSVFRVFPDRTELDVPLDRFCLAAGEHPGAP